MNSTSWLLALSLCLLGATPCWADSRAPSLADAPVVASYSLLQEAPSIPPTPGVQPEDERPLEDPRHAQYFRLLSELGLGLAGGLGGGLLGYGVGVATERPCGPGGLCLQLEKFIYAYVGLSLGIPAGVWLGGTLQGGNGHVLFTLLGAVVGILASGLVAYAQSNIVILGIAGVGLPLAFSMVGYELSHSLRTPAAPPRAQGLRVRPLVAPVPGGALVGLGGRF